MKLNQPSTMTVERIQLLEDLGFVFDGFGSVWEQKVAELKEFRSRFGHCNVPW